MARHYNLPRFPFDASLSFVADTVLIVSGDDHFLLGVLASWATWFFISKTAQPLRLRSDRWQYRLKAQYMEDLRIPDGLGPDREAIAELARKGSVIGQERYAAEMLVRRRLRQAFGEPSALPFNQKAEAWWANTVSSRSATPSNKASGFRPTR